MLGKLFANNYGVSIIMTRSFNHIGPYQDTRFVIPSYVRRILDVVESGASKGIIETGDTTLVRDFLDVRDVVRAYYMLLTAGTPGEVYNICSGEGVELEKIITEIADLLSVDIKGKINPDYVRPGDNQKVIGSFDKINKELGWKPEIPLRLTLKEMIDDYRKTNESMENTQ